jgi:type IV secretion system protein TrbJ
VGRLARTDSGSEYGMRMKRRMTILFAISALLMSAAPSRVEAGGVFATEFTQLLNHVELLHQYLQQVRMVENDLLRYSLMLRNSQALPAQIFGPVSRDLQQLAQVVQGGHALAYSMANLDAQFRNRFPGYAYAWTPNAFYSNYAQWSDTSLDTTYSTLAGVGLQSQQLQDEQTILEALRQQAQNPAGQMDAIQVGTEISEQEVEQLMKLRELMMLDLQSKQAYQAAQIQKDEANATGQQRFFTSTSVQADGATFP